MKNLQNLKPRKRALHIANVTHRAFSSSVTFEDFLRNNANPEGFGGSEFRLVINQEHPDGTLEIYCHPLGRDGETYDGYVKHFTIDPKQAIDNLMKYLREKPTP